MHLNLWGIHFTIRYFHYDPQVSENSGWLAAWGLYVSIIENRRNGLWPILLSVPPSWNYFPVSHEILGSHYFKGKTKQNKKLMLYFAPFITMLPFNGSPITNFRLKGDNDTVCCTLFKGRALSKCALLREACYLYSFLLLSTCLRNLVFFKPSVLLYQAMCLSNIIHINGKVPNRT